MNTQVAKIPSEKTFTLDYFSELEKKQYRGTFTVKRPTVFMQAQITGKKSQILGGRYHDEATPGAGVPEFMDMMAEMMAFLSVTLVQVPAWWDSNQDDGGLHDPQVLGEVYQLAVQVDPFRRVHVVSGAESGAGGEEGGEAHSAARPSDIVAQMVGE